jgi:hypothetical protein
MLLVLGGRVHVHTGGFRANAVRRYIGTAVACHIMVDGSSALPPPIA